MSGLILYTTEDGASRIQLRPDSHTVWLTQADMAELIEVSAENTRRHLKNVISDRELEPERTSKDSLVVQPEGGRDVRRRVTLYNLDAILAVGYRVRSPRGVQFRLLGHDGAEGVLGQGLRHGRRAPEEPGRSPGPFRRDASAHPRHPRLGKAFLPESARPVRAEHGL